LDATEPDQTLFHPRLSAPAARINSSGLGESEKSFRRPSSFVCWAIRAEISSNLCPRAADLEFAGDLTDVVGKPVTPQPVCAVAAARMHFLLIACDEVTQFDVFRGHQLIQTALAKGQIGGDFVSHR